MAVETGRRLGRYVLVSRLGSGGMGEVFEAEDTTLGRRVAVKVLTGPGTDEDGVERFRVEARAVARLSHPNILAIHDFGIADGTPFAVMELLEGRTLRALVDEGPLDLPTAVDYATQMARGLAAAHAKGIAHRDIKPENVFITGDGLAKLLDFGIAAMHDASPSPAGVDARRDTAPLSLDAPARGTAGYLSPEQARGLPADHRADVFSFGAVLYELVTGVRVFDGETTIDALHAVLYREVPPLHRIRRGVPPALDRIVSRCLAREPERRYQSTADLVADLQDVARDLRAVPETPPQKEAGTLVPAPVAATPPAGATTTPPPARARRRWWPWAMAAFGSSVLLLIATVIGLGAGRPAPLKVRDRLLIADVANQTRDPVFDGTLKQGLEVQLAQSPFLNLAAPAEVADALAFMGRRRDEPVTAAIARELCLRNGITAYITGSITPMGRSYVIGLQAIAAADGTVIAREQIQADRKENVLPRLGQAATSLRRTLGESLPSIQRFDAPIEQATTSSLEALRAYAAGVEQTNRGRYQEALASYRRATEIDDTFALAYQAVARQQYNISFSPAIETAATKAFELRQRTTESESLRISSFYHLVVTRNLTKAIEIAELWRQTYPNRWQPHIALSDVYYTVGRLDESIAASNETLRLNSKVGPAYSNLAGALVLQNRFAGAEAVYARAQQQGLDAPEFHFFRFWIAQWLDKTSDQQAQFEWLDRSTQPQLGIMLRSQAAAFAGRWRESRQLTRQAMERAERAGNPDASTQLAVFDAPIAALMEDCAEARSLATRASTSSWPNEQAQAALALALCGDVPGALAIVDRLASGNAEDTLLQSLWVPLVRAATMLAANRASDALGELDRTGTYGITTIWRDLLRGQALLRMGEPARAVEAFRSLRGNRGRFTWTFPVYPLSHLWLARAAAPAGDDPLARDEYEALLVLWKDADADLGPLVAARHELARLRRD